MKILVVEDYAALSAAGAEILESTVREKPNCVLGLATGETPIGLYDILVKKYAEGLDFSKVQTVNLDEYYPLEPTNEQSYRAFMNMHLFDKININKDNTNVPDGLAADVDKFCGEYEALIDSLGGIDVQLLGIGRNGHIGFNEPADELYPYTHLTALKEDTIQANSRFFENEADVPRSAITMGMASIFKAKRIVILASGAGKANAVKTLATGRITTACPATLLHLHPDVTLICDKAAYGNN
ncbi:MAG: glucosamine-6-phosphate deaminase [Ruminococcaceae bacterium]|nr:glucosamine-6-phosphate deaminase [Oscillospiraceae bacterium]